MNRVSGFTLFELLIVLVIAAVLVTVAVPGFRGFIVGQELKNVTQGLHMDLLYARSEAIKRNADVELAANDGDWNTGWFVTTDATVTSIDCTDDTTAAAVLRAGCSISGSNNIEFEDPDAPAVTFRGNGRLVSNSSPFVLCDDTGRQAREVRVGVDGMPQIKRLDKCP